MEKRGWDVFGGICHCKMPGKRMRSVRLYRTALLLSKRVTNTLDIILIFFSFFTLRPLILLFTHPQGPTDAHCRRFTIVTPDTLQSVNTLLSPSLHPCSSSQRRPTQQTCDSDG
jgi:hypothetical protein